MDQSTTSGADERERVILTTINSIPVYRNFITNLPANPALRSRAVTLRKAGNLPEVIFWKQVHRRKFHKIDFDRQRIIGNYIVDFYVKSLSLIVEIDGSSHKGKELYDARREEYLLRLGLNIFRIPTTRIRFDLYNVMRELEEFIVKHYG